MFNHNVTELFSLHSSKLPLSDLLTFWYHSLQKFTGLNLVFSMGWVTYTKF